MNNQPIRCPKCQGQRTTDGINACNKCGGAGLVSPPLPANVGKFLRAPYWYALFNGMITAAAPNFINSALTIDSRADFEWVWSVSTQTGTFTTELTDKSGRAMQSAPVNNANMFGTIQLPLTWPVPVILPMKSNINFRIVNTSGVDNTIQAIFLGYELYPQIDANGQPVSLPGPNG